MLEPDVPEKREKARARASAWYYAHRQLHPDTSEEHAASRQRMSIAKKNDWDQRMSAEAKAAALKGLRIGTECKIAREAEERRKWAWDAIKLYLDGRNRRQIIADLHQRGCTPKTLATVFREVGLPLGKKGLHDRGQIFTRFRATQLQKSLGYTPPEFASQISERKRLPTIWLTGPQKGLNPPVAKKCLAVRERVAKALLTKDTRSLPEDDQYNRVNAVITLFPNLQREYRTLLAVLPGLKSLIAGAPDQIGENQLAEFVIRNASLNTNRRDEYRSVLRWLPELASHLVRTQQRIADEPLLRRVAYEILSATTFCPSKIVAHAIEDGVRPISRRRMREIVRQHVGVHPQMPDAASDNKTRRKLPLKESEPYKIWQQVEAKIPKFAEMIRFRRSLPRSIRRNPIRCREELLKKYVISVEAQARETEVVEVELVLRAKEAVIAARNFVTRTRRFKSPQTVPRYHAMVNRLLRQNAGGVESV